MHSGTERIAHREFKGRAKSLLRVGWPDSIYTLQRPASGLGHTSCGIAALRPLPESLDDIFLPVLPIPHPCPSPSLCPPRMKYRGRCLCRSGRRFSRFRPARGARGCPRERANANKSRCKMDRATYRADEASRIGECQNTVEPVCWHRRGRCIKGRRVNGQPGSTGRRGELGDRVLLVPEGIVKIRIPQGNRLAADDGHLSRVG